MRLISQRHHHGSLHGGGHNHAGVLAAINQVRHQLGGTGNERGTVTGEVRLLRQRVHRKQAGEVAIAHARIQDRRHRLTAAHLIPSTPTELRIAFVRCHHGTDFTRLRHNLTQLLHGTHHTVRVRRGVHPNQLHTAAGVSVQLIQAVSGHGLGAGEAGTHIVGGVRNARVHDHIARAQTQQERQPRHELLRADRGHDRVRAQTGHAAAARKPLSNSLTQGEGAVGGRVAGSVRGSSQRLANVLRGRVDRGADGQVHRTVRVGGRGCAVGGERLPGVFGQVQAVSHCVTWLLGNSFRHFSLASGRWRAYSKSLHSSA